MLGTIAASRQNSAGVAGAYRAQWEVIKIDLAPRFPQDGLKVAWRGQLGEPLAIIFLVRWSRKTRR
jgi:hypothetical protein